MSLLLIIAVAIAIPLLLVATLVAYEGDGPRRTNRLTRWIGSILPLSAALLFFVGGSAALILAIHEPTWLLVAGAVYLYSLAGRSGVHLLSIHRPHMAGLGMVRWLFLLAAVGDAALAVLLIVAGIRESPWLLPLAIFPAWFAYVFLRIVLRPQEIGETDESHDRPIASNVRGDTAG